MGKKVATAALLVVLSLLMAALIRRPLGPSLVVQGEWQLVELSPSQIDETTSAQTDRSPAPSWWSGTFASRVSDLQSLVMEMERLVQRKGEPSSVHALHCEEGVVAVASDGAWGVPLEPVVSPSIDEPYFSVREPYDMQESEHGATPGDGAPLASSRFDGDATVSVADLEARWYRRLPTTGTGALRSGRWITLDADGTGLAEWKPAQPEADSRHEESRPEGDVKVGPSAPPSAGPSVPLYSEEPLLHVRRVMPITDVAAGADSVLLFGDAGGSLVAVDREGRRLENPELPAVEISLVYGAAWLGSEDGYLVEYGRRPSYLLALSAGDGELELSGSLELSERGPEPRFLEVAGGSGFVYDGGRLVRVDSRGRRAAVRSVLERPLGVESALLSGLYFVGYPSGLIEVVNEDLEVVRQVDVGVPLFDLRGAEGRVLFSHAEGIAGYRMGVQ